MWIALGRPLVEGPRGAVPALAKAEARLADGKHGAAYVEAGKVDHPSAATLRAQIELAVSGAVKRAEALRDLGYPKRALDLLVRHAASCKGVPGVDAVNEAARVWKRDPTFKAALKGETRIVKAEAQVAKLAGRSGTAAEAAAVWDALLANLGDSCLAARLQALRKGAGVQN